MRKIIKLTTAEVAQLCQEYQDEGKSVDALAGEFGLHRQTILGYLKRAGIQMRRRPGLNAEQIETAVRLYGQGWSTYRLGKHFQLSPNAVRNTLIKAGVRMRNKTDWHRLRRS
jgi:lambda repressor-like predicted transcriptional regulator